MNRTNYFRTPKTPSNELSRRELQILAMLAAHAFSDREVAEELSISESTVGQHIHNAYRKIGARNRVEACTWYLKNKKG